MATPTRLLLLVSAVLYSAATAGGQVTDCRDVETLTGCASNFTSNIDTTLIQTVSDFRTQICEVEEIHEAAWCVVSIIIDCPTLADDLELLTTDFPTVVGLIEQEYSSMDALCNNLCGIDEDCVSQLGSNMGCIDNVCVCSSGFYPNPEGGGCVLDCGAVSDPADGTTELDSTGVTATVTCNAGFELSTGTATETITCQADASWSALPTCTAGGSTSVAWSFYVMFILGVITRLVME